MTNAAMNEMNTQNSAFDVDDVKLSDLEALDLVLQKPEIREAFLEQIDRLVRDKEEILQRQEAYKELINSTKSAFKFKTTKMLNLVVDTVVKQNLEDSITNAEAEADLLTVVKDYVENK